MTSTTTTAVSTTTASSTSTSTCIPTWTIPSNDVACAGAITGNITDVFDSCCKGNSPVKYNDDCNIYCLAQGQTKKELSDCLTDKSKNYSGIFCGQGKDNSTATASATTTRETDSDATGTSTNTGKGSSTSTGAAILSQPISKTGLGLVAMLFCSAVAGVIA